MVNFLLRRQMVMIRTWRKILLRDISKNAQIQLFDSYMHFPVILTPWIWNFSTTMVRNSGLKKFKKHSWENINPLGVHWNMRGCILEVILKDWGGNRQHVRLPFCWFWPEGWDISCKCLKKISCKFQENVCFLGVFWWLKIAFKSSLDLYYHPSIIEFRMGEKIHTKAVADVSRGAGGRIFLWEIREGVSRNLLSQVKLYYKGFEMKFKSKFNHGITNRGCWHCAILKA